MEEVPGGGVAASEVHVFKRVSKFIDYGGPKVPFSGTLDHYFYVLVELCCFFFRFLAGFQYFFVCLL